MTLVRLELTAPWSRVKHSTTEPLRSQMMTDTKCYVPWRVGYNFRLAKFLEKHYCTLWWMSTLFSVEGSYRNKLTISLTNKATLAHHFRGFLRKVTKTVICLGCASLHQSHIQQNYYHSATFPPNLKPQIDFIKLLEPIKDDKWRKNSCLYLQINFVVGVFDDRSWILMANIDDRS